jgi:class 3 adenylate cyclase
MRQSLTIRKLSYLVVMPLAVAFLATFLAYRVVERYSSLASLVDVMDAQRAASMRGAAPARNDIQVITFDDSTGQRLGLGSYVTAALPRSVHAELIRLLDQAGARVALVDVIFSAPKPDDRKLLEVLNSLHSMKVTLATGLEANQHMDPSLPIPSGPLYPISLSGQLKSDRVRVGSVRSEISDLQSLFLGGNPVQRDANTGREVLYAPVSAALESYDIPPSRLAFDVRNNRLTADALEWNLDENYAINARWTGVKNAFRHWDYVDALAALRDPVKRAAFRNQIVVIGKAGSSDVIESGPFGSMDGVDFIAQMTNTAMLGFNSQVHRAPDGFAYPFGIALSFIGFLAIRSRRLVPAAGALVALSAVCFGLQRWFAVDFDMRLGTTGPLLALLLTSTVAMFVGRYWTDHVNLSPPSASEEATILFLDIRGSTQLLHTIGRAKYQSLLTELFGRYTAIVSSSGGQIERALGDGFIAVFRDKDSRHHALRCADCCNELVRATEWVARERNVELKAALGFESGIVGGVYVNESGKKVWSSQGSTVHLAQRLQTLCGQLGMKVAVGPVARRLIADEKSCELITRAYVKGFQDEVEVCSLYMG